MSDSGFQFEVAGIPVPQGSMRKSMHGTMIHSNPNLEKWRTAVGWTAKSRVPRRWSKAGPFDITATFFFARPKYLPATVTMPIQHKNDIDKLARAILDAMSKIVYDDDGQVIDLHVRKRFGLPHAQISVDRLLG